MSDGVDGSDDVLGPVGCVAVEFPDGRLSGAGFDRLLESLERGTVRVLDLESVTKRDDGSVATVAVGGSLIPVIAAWLAAGATASSPTTGWHAGRPARPALDATEPDLAVRAGRPLGDDTPASQPRARRYTRCG